MGNSELTWWPIEAGYEIARDGAELVCRDQARNPVDGLPPEVARTRRYPAWVLVNRPTEAEIAETAGAELAGTRSLKTHDIALRVERIARGLPAEHLPVFFEQAARLLVQCGDQKRAGTLFAQARAIEAEQGSAIEDEAWLAAHREFAAFGALNTKATADFVKGLKNRAKPDVALEALTRVAVLRALAGLAPWAQLPKQVSAYAKAAGRDEIEVHQELLEQLCGARAALQDAPAAMWTAWQPILVRVCARSAAVRGLLLEILPQPESLDGWWLGLLAECGATAGLVRADVADDAGNADSSGNPEVNGLTKVQPQGEVEGEAQVEVQPVGGRAAWLARRVHHPNLNSVLRGRSRYSKLLSDELNELIVRMAPALRADGVPVQLDGPDYWTKRVDVRVVETCLTHGVPIAELKQDAGLGLELWWRSRRPGEDLPATAADPYFGPIVRKWAGIAEKRGEGPLLWALPSLRPFLTPPADVETAEEPHPLDGPYVHGAVHAFGHHVGIMGVAPKRPLHEIRKLSRALRDGQPLLEQDVQGLGLSALLVGRLEWPVLRAITPSSSEERRDLVTAFLEVWAESVFAEPDIRSLLESADIAAKFPVTGDDSRRWDTADRLRRLVALLRERGPVPRSPGDVTPLMEHAGLSRPGAEFALAGLIGVSSYNVPLLATEERKALGLSAKQMEDGRSELAAIGREVGLELTLGILPDDPAELWEPGGMAGVAGRLAANWSARFGQKPTVPEATLAAAPDFGASQPAQPILLALADPSGSALLTRDIDSWLVPGSRDGAAWYSSEDYRVGEFERWLQPLVLAMMWAYAALRADDPVRVGVPEALRLLRRRLANPRLILMAGSCGRATSAEDLAQRFGPAPYEGPVPVEDTTFDDGLTIVASRGSSTRLYFRPAFYGVDGRTAELDATAVYGRHTLAVVQFLTDPVCDRIVERIESGGLPAGSCEADPRASVPELVAEVAGHLGLETDAAALYLQLLAVPQPTDARVRAWNAWRPAQHKAAVAALVARGLVVEDKRSKAGRGVFLPGDWTKANSAAKVGPYEESKAEVLRSVGVQPAVEWPRVPWTELFAAAAQRVVGRQSQG